VNYLLRTGVPIERHATRVYTRAMFERFFRELFRAGALVCRESEEANRFIVTYACSSSSTVSGRREFIVTTDAEKTDYSCICKSFDHCGMPCRHVLKVTIITSSRMQFTSSIFVFFSVRYQHFFDVLVGACPHRRVRAPRWTVEEEMEHIC
jgi:hypothetical protein